jgi:lipid-A-disaccharide synthase
MNSAAALLPGSRHKELIRILPPMLDAVHLIKQQQEDAQFVVVVAPNRSLDEARSIAANKIAGSSVHFIHHETREALAAADVAAIASGTATLEAALLGTPMVIVYKESTLNWHALGSLITTEHYGLANLIAGRRLVTELIQDDLNGESLAHEVLKLLDPTSNAAMRAELSEVIDQIGEPGASDRAARAILDFIG